MSFERPYRTGREKFGGGETGKWGTSSLCREEANEWRSVLYV